MPNKLKYIFTYDAVMLPTRYGHTHRMAEKINNCGHTIIIRSIPDTCYVSELIDLDMIDLVTNTMDPSDPDCPLKQ